MVVGFRVGDAKADRHLVQKRRLRRLHALLRKVRAHSEKQFVGARDHLRAGQQRLPAAPIRRRHDSFQIYPLPRCIDAPQLYLHSGSRASLNGVQHVGSELTGHSTPPCSTHFCS